MSTAAERHAADAAEIVETLWPGAQPAGLAETIRQILDRRIGDAAYAQSLAATPDATIEKDPSDPVCAAMDRRFEWWDLYRTVDGRWIVRVRQNGREESFDNRSLLFALKAAMEWKCLPQVPRRPALLIREEFQPVKNGSKWRLQYERQDWGIQVRTKAEAVGFIDRAMQTNIRAVEAWDEVYGWTRSKTEGVDFEWKR